MDDFGFGTFIHLVEGLVGFLVLVILLLVSLILAGVV